MHVYWGCPYSVVCMFPSYSAEVAPSCTNPYITAVKCSGIIGDVKSLTASICWQHSIQWPRETAPERKQYRRTRCITHEKGVTMQNCIMKITTTWQHTMLEPTGLYHVKGLGGKCLCEWIPYIDMVRQLWRAGWIQTVNRPNHLLGQAQELWLFYM